MKIGSECAIGKLGYGARHLYACRTAADDYEGEKTLALDWIGFGFRTLERQQNSPPQIGGVVDGLETRRVECPVVVTEICVLGSRRQDEEVIRDASAFRNNFTADSIDTRNRGESHRDIALCAYDAADRCGDIGRRKTRGCDLIQQGLEQVIVVPIDQRDLARGSGQPLGRGQPAEAGAHNHDARYSGDWKGFFHIPPPPEAFRSGSSFICGGHEGPKDLGSLTPGLFWFLF